MRARLASAILILATLSCVDRAKLGPETGVLDITITGLPIYPANVSLDGPGNYHANVIASHNFDLLTPGTYTVTVNPVNTGLSTYTGTGGGSFTVTASNTPVPVNVAYSLATGELSVTVNGLPNGALAAVIVTGPNAYDTVLQSSATMGNLTPGAYIIKAQVVNYGGTSYSPNPDSTSKNVPLGTTPVLDTVTYAQSTGSLAVTVTGTPGGLNPDVVVTGPNSYNQPISTTGTTTLPNLPLGTYTVAGNNVSNSTDTYAPAPASQNKTVSIANPNQLASVTYSVSSGGLTVTVNGLPGGTNANVTVTGPGGYNQGVTATTTLHKLTPGTYTVTSANVSSGGNTYVGAPASQNIVVSASTTPANATVTYSISSGGSLAITVTGTPGGLNPSVSVTGPGGFSQTITTTGTTTYNGLTLGAYTIIAANVSNVTDTYAGTPVSQGKTLTVGSPNQSATVTYAVSTGGLTVTISGLPGGVNASVNVTGPGSFNQSPTATTTYHKLTPGNFTINASNVVSGGNTYIPSPTSQVIAVPKSTTPATGTVAYTASSGLDLTVDAVEVIQTTQNYTDTVPLVANKAAFVRVFVHATQANSVMPVVRVRWYSSGVLSRTDNIAAPRASVPLQTFEDTLSTTWNLSVPAALIQKNLSILVDVDPSNLIPETNEANNCWPASCTAKALDVRTVTTFHQMMVPVKEAKNGATGNVTGANMASFDVFSLKIHPIVTVAQVLHATYTTTDAVDTLQPNDTNGMWGTILNEITTLRMTEATTPLLDSTYYYGVVHPGYGGGVAGVAWVGALQTAIGWDRGSNDQILAHETGHNWGNNHAFGCGAAGVDPNYPRLDGKLDAFGYDPAANVLYDSTKYYDVMSYCKPSWTSNYQYIRILNFRASQPDVFGGGAGDVAQPVLLVWGRVVNGKMVLEPAFEVTTRAKLPEGRGSYSIEGTDDGGGTLFSYAFEPAMMMDTRFMGTGFAFAIPLASFDVSRLAKLRLRGPEGEASVEGGAAVAAARVGGKQVTASSARMVGARRARVSWDERYTMAMIRDAESGQVLSFARGKGVELEVPGTRLQIVLSDGVRSVTENVIAQ